MLRLTHQKALNKLFKHNTLPDVIDHEISDHRPIVGGRYLFWNVMKRGTKIGDQKFDNGFGWEESKDHYQDRIMLMAVVIAFIIHKNPAIEFIGICEGPIKDDINLFMLSLASFKWMKKFLNKLHQPIKTDPKEWGVYLMADEKYQVEPVEINIKQFIQSKSEVNFISKLANRLQLWQIKENHRTEYLMLSHFPIGPPRSAVKDSKKLTPENISPSCIASDSKELTADALFYKTLINYFITIFKSDWFVWMSDFNFNPFLFGANADRYLDHIPVHNSVMSLIQPDSKNVNQYTVTVDGIMFSEKSKQKYYQALASEGLFSRLKLENKLALDVFSRLSCHPIQALRKY